MIKPKNGKYSLYGTLVIWVFYAVVSFMFVVPITMGMNVEIRTGAIIAMALYLFLHIFRFLSWNLLSYILTWGGELKIIFWQEVISTVYFIVLYIFASYILSNVYLLYFLITIPTILQTILGLILFKRKKMDEKT